jgi:crotonobetainyl-CoA:carnitine CoA-transferase CaiB-like acyl-CoA transferase
MTSPLSGVLVVSVEQAVAAPLCTARLVDAGARVIKIERRQGGDFARGYDYAARGDSSYFVWINHGKESIELNFKQADDAALLHRMISRADVLVQNLAPGALSRAGFDLENLRQQHPRLITCDISGYGDSKAASGMKAYDLLVQAESGLISISGGPGEPGRIGVSLCDIGAGLTAYSGILEALLRRGVTGKGGGLSVSLFDVAAEWMTVPLIHTETGSGAPERVGLKHPGIAPYGAFPDRDGTLTLISIQNEHEWQRLCGDVLGKPGLARDIRYLNNNERVAHREALDSAITAITLTRSTHELRTALATASIAFGALNSVNELAAHVCLRRRNLRNSKGLAVSLPAHPVVHDYSLPAALVVHDVSGTAVKSTDEGMGTAADSLSAQVPSSGQHTASVRKEFA